MLSLVLRLPYIIVEWQKPYQNRLLAQIIADVQSLEEFLSNK